MAAAGPSGGANFEQREDFRRNVLEPLNAMAGLREFRIEEKTRLVAIADKLNELSKSVISEAQKKMMERLSEDIKRFASRGGGLSLSELSKDASSIFHAVYFAGNKFGDLPNPLLGKVGEYVGASELGILSRFGEEQTMIDATYIHIRPFLTENEKQRCQGKVFTLIDAFNDENRQHATVQEIAVKREKWANEMLAFFPLNQYEEVRKDNSSVLNFLVEISNQLTTEEQRKRFAMNSKKLAEQGHICGEQEMMLAKAMYIWDMIKNELPPDVIRANMGNLSYLRNLTNERDIHYKLNS